MSEPLYGIRVVAQRTGLTPYVIRIWEKRYEAVTPSRTPTKRRLYSSEEVERLQLLHLATQAGHSIGTIARLPNEALSTLSAEMPKPIPAYPATAPRMKDLLEECIVAVRTMDSAALDSALSQAAAQHGQHGLLQHLAAPLAAKVGELWREGTITAAHEHFASAVIRSFLVRNSRPFAVSGDMPVILVATPSGQLHELGAVMVAAAANDVGWRVIYLGSSLPAADIAAAAAQNQVRAVALSLVYPEDDPNLPGELETLRKYPPGDAKIVVGGRAAASYEEVLERIGAIRMDSLSDFYHQLDALRRARRRS
jgi:MerR family transcriptional regulator, light-induced transcriptional regulator